MTRSTGWSLYQIRSKKVSGRVSDSDESEGVTRDTSMTLSEETISFGDFFFNPVVTDN
ncbi:hypothetical protein F2Q70_00027320 [Brassica cretica]|uniref:Uncharacterized protein n=1 Tax=Brassica cretica TaxID=69181 RepID=A0A8S9LKF0_BRACR|nr:hypothetical protein F2Q70_00027320 [Brassica cretica]